MAREVWSLALYLAETTGMRTQQVLRARSFEAALPALVDSLRAG